MSVSEVIGMSKFVSGGAILAALFISAAATAQTSATNASAPKVSHARSSFFNSNQARADVPAHVQKMFAQLDLNHDGFVTRDEIAVGQARFDERMAKSTPIRVSKMFDRLDSNHDGQITNAEVEAARAARLAATHKQSGAGHRPASSSLFARADGNKDGIVTRAEYAAAVANGKVKLRHANMRGSAIVRLFDAADANKDGRVSLEEAQQAALQHFDAADANHDGTLTPDERRQASKAERAKRGTA
jgi:Ca2+-binding EF-hand superfamily protein